MLPKKGEPRKVTIDESKTVLGSNAVFKGELTFKDTLCIDGEFEGKLTTSDKLIVAEEGAVLANIEAGTVICRGKITGNVIASQKVEIHSTGKILGDVHAPAIMVELGAVILGSTFLFLPIFLSTYHFLFYQSHLLNPVFAWVARSTLSLRMMNDL